MIFIANTCIYNKEKEKNLYEIVKINGDKAYLRGVEIRKKIIVNVDDVEIVDDSEFQKGIIRSEKYKKRLLSCVEARVTNCLLGTVLHIDADEKYLNKCLGVYREVGIYCYPVLSEEKDLVQTIKKLNVGFIPDVIVITGHDLFKGGNKRDLMQYKNSVYFVEATKEMRGKFPDAILIVGACQSHFEALIANGANFASSPQRINVHIYDPVIIAISVCTTSFKNIVDFENLKKYIQEFKGAYGGFEVYGKMKKMY